MRRLPSLAYDSLQPDTSGLATADVVDSFNGAPDRYDWELLGKREMLMPYNSYAVHQKGISYDTIVQPRTLNPDLLRYELHRVWVVEATLRKGFSHLYDKRRFYIDEDSWAIPAVDLYDEGAADRPAGKPSDQLLRRADVQQHAGDALPSQGWQLLRRRHGQQRADVRFQREARPTRFLAAGAASRQLRITGIKKGATGALFHAWHSLRPPG